MRLKAGLLMVLGLALFALAAVFVDRLVSFGPAAGLSGGAMALRYAGALSMAAAGGLSIQKGLKIWFLCGLRRSETKF